MIQNDFPGRVSEYQSVVQGHHTSLAENTAYPAGNATFLPGMPVVEENDTTPMTDDHSSKIHDPTLMLRTEILLC
jgi:hypothetical protein